MNINMEEYSRRLNKRKFGIIGEKIAQGYLKNIGYEIVTTNFFTRNGEIDIIAVKDKYIVFVEVKTRTSYKFGTPAMAVNHTKKKHIRCAAGAFLKSNKYYGYSVRFDVIEVLIIEGKCKINHIKQIM